MPGPVQRGLFPDDELVALSGPVADAAQQTWAVLPIRAIGVDPTTAGSFRELLATEVRQKLGARLVGQGLTPCADMPCARAAGQRAGAQFVLMSSASRLGQKTIITAAVIDVARGVQASSQRMSVARVEELDAVATRVVAAITEGKTTEPQLP